MLSPGFISFIAGGTGTWEIDSMTAVCGGGLAPAERLEVAEGAPAVESAVWQLRGVVSNMRYTTRDELDRLVTRQEALGRPGATRAALIPIRKKETWWALAQDERRTIFEEQSHHTAIGLEYLPAIARRLHHSRELGEPFDFLTWFEYAPRHSGVFDEMLARLRASREWEYVDGEVDIRLSREG